MNNKKTYPILLIGLLLIFGQTFGQDTKIIDSLERIIKQSKKNTSTVNALNDLAWEYRKNNTSEAEIYANKAIELSDSLSFTSGKITGLVRLGTVKIYQKEYNIAEKIFDTVLKKETIIGNAYGIARANNQLGRIYTEQEELQKALYHILKADSILEQLGKTSMHAVTSNNAGDLYRRLGNYDKATEYLLKSLTLVEASNNKRGMANSYTNLGILEIDLVNYKKALAFLNKAEVIQLEYKNKHGLAKTYNNKGIVYFEQGEYDKSLEFHTKSLTLKTQLEIQEKDASIYNNLATIYRQKGNLEGAIRNYQKSLEIEKSSMTYNNFGNTFFEQKDYTKAIEQYSKALEMAKENSEQFELMRAYNNLSDCYSAEGNYQKSIDYNNDYLQVRDSIENSYKDAVNQKADYEQEKKELALLQKDQTITQERLEKSELKSNRQDLIIAGLIGGTLLLSLLFFALLRGNKQRQKAVLSEKNREIEQQKVEELLKNQELKFINAKTVGQEEERTRIAQDLHDRLGSMLSMVKTHFKSVETNIDKVKTANSDLYEKANKLLDEACEEVRKISHDMVSGVLNEFGLTAAVEDLAETLEESKKMEVEFVSHGIDSRLDSKLEIAIYRIIQELVNNILKHSKATEITLQLVKGKKGLNVMVEDNGIGFDPEQTNKGMGLKNIASRADAFGGTMQIDSSLGKNTTITIDIPLKNKEL
jgi:signal transduction histidine kinase/Flp pilus assembly protein TadD